MKKISEGEKFEENIRRLMKAALETKTDERVKEEVFQHLVSMLHDRSKAMDYPWQAVLGLGFLMFLIVGLSLSRLDASIFAVNPAVLIMLMVVGINFLMLPAVFILIIIRRRNG